MTFEQWIEPFIDDPDGLVCVRKVKLPEQFCVDPNPQVSIVYGLDFGREEGRYVVTYNEGHGG